MSLPGQLFKPVYGEHFEVRPKHWWSPRQRKAAKIAARVMDYYADRTFAEAKRHPLNEAPYGVSCSRPRWDRE